MDRTIIAYALIALMTLAALGVVGWRLYYSRERVNRRLRARRMADHRTAMAARTTDDA